jgi:hypothetical protein
MSFVNRGSAVRPTRSKGDLDVRGTLGIEKDVPVGFKQIRLRIVLDADASPDERARLMELTEFSRFSDTSAAAIPEYLDEGARDPNLDARLNRVRYRCPTKSAATLNYGRSSALHYGIKTPSGSSRTATRHSAILTRLDLLRCLSGFRLRQERCAEAQ